MTRSDFDLVPRDEACAHCGDEATHFIDPLAERVPACRACWLREAQPREAPRPRGPDWAERNPEAADHQATADRQRIVDNTRTARRVRL